MALQGVQSRVALQLRPPISEEPVSLPKPASAGKVPQLIRTRCTAEHSAKRYECVNCYYALEEGQEYNPIGGLLMKLFVQISHL
jgi:hypothetical protein